MALARDILERVTKELVNEINDAEVDTAAPVGFSEWMTDRCQMLIFRSWIDIHSCAIDKTEIEKQCTLDNVKELAKSRLFFPVKALYEVMCKAWYPKDEESTTDYEDGFTA